jgi:hypothetical protein
MYIRKDLLIMTQFHEENLDYGDWTDAELAEELLDIEQIIYNCQQAISNARKSMNRNMDTREKLLDVISQRTQAKGWKK